MVKASDVIGRQITVREGGQDIGKIKDLVVDHAGREVIGIVLSDGMFSGCPGGALEGRPGLRPRFRGHRRGRQRGQGSAAPEIKAVLDKKTKIKGLKLLTTKGKELGKIVDVDFDETTGDVSGYELSGGLFSDTFSGTPFLPTPAMDRAGQGRGLRGARRSRAQSCPAAA